MPITKATNNRYATTGAIMFAQIIPVRRVPLSTLRRMVQGGTNKHLEALHLIKDALILANRRKLRMRQFKAETAACFKRAHICPGTLAHAHASSKQILCSVNLQF